MVHIAQLKNISTYTSLLQARNVIGNFSRVLYSTKKAKEKEYRKCYEILNISENSDQDAIRHAYLQMVKRYHPDSPTSEADANKFQEIDRAFRMLIDKQAKERWQVPEENVEEKAPHHATPQHRHYLDFEGIGYGTVFQREKQYSQSRAMKASQAVMNHRIQKAIADDKSLIEKAHQKHNIKTKYGFDRLVEDLIQEAMSKGQFDNLSGTGKPLPEVKRQNLYVDFITHKLNEILIENGFTPEWITLQKEIRDELQFIRNTLYTKRAEFPQYPLNEQQLSLWQNEMHQHKSLVDELNRKINKYNLLVPVLNKQMFFINMEKEAHKILVEGKYKQKAVEKDTNAIQKKESPNFISAFFHTLFKL